jgi:FMN phosphatase YigB (HAD superfamily)
MLRAIIFDLDGTLLDWSGFDGDWESMARERLKPVYAFLAGGGHKLPEFSFFVNDINTRSMLSWRRGPASLSVGAGARFAPLS